MVGRVHRLAQAVGRRDREMAEQMRASSGSVAANFAEGIWARGNKRRNRLDDSLNSARETAAWLACAVEAGYLQSEAVGGELRELDECIAQLWVLTYRPKYRTPA
jgi:four helix bundle protein